MICEGCIKQDTCKFKDAVELYEEGLREKTPDAPKNPLVWPLEITTSCKYRQGPYSPPIAAPMSPWPLFPHDPTWTGDSTTGLGASQ